jgi:putative endonuclease
MKSYFIYAIKSLYRNYIYVGLSQSPENRLAEHNLGKTKSNRPYGPFKIIFTDGPFDLKIARDKEKYYKSGCGKEFLKSISR